MNALFSARKLGLLYGLIGVLIFSGTLPATRIAVLVFDPWFVTFGRALLAGATAITILAVLRKSIPWQHWRLVLGAGVLVAVGFPGFMGLAMLSVPAVHGGVVLGILPLATAIFAAILGGERPSPLFWFWGLAGTGLVIIFAVQDGAFGLVLGDFWLFVAALSAACGYVFLARLTRIMPGWEAISWALVSMLPVSAIGSAVFWNPVYVQAPLPQLISFLYLSLFSMYIAFFAWNAGLNLGGIARVGQIQLLQTFFTLGIAASVLGEPVGLQALAFSAAVLVVIIMGQRARIGQTLAG